MKSLRLFCSLLAAAALSAAAFAADAAGTWKWSFEGPNGQMETTLKLALKDGKLAGTYSNQFGETAVSNAMLKDGTLTFAVERDLGGNKFTLKFSGKLDGDTIKGEFEAPNFDGGGSRKVEWHAQREKEKSESAKK